MYDVSYPVAWSIWVSASAVYSEKMYQLMMHLLNQDIYISIDRNPSRFNGRHCSNAMKIIPL